MVQTCVDHLGCLLGALVVPERGVAICKAPPGERPQVEILTKIHRHLLNWAQLQRRNLVINKLKVRPIELPPYKILCTPVRHASGRVLGFLVMFRAEDGPNFDARTERLVRAPGAEDRRRCCRPTTTRSPPSSRVRPSRHWCARSSPRAAARFPNACCTWTWTACTSSMTTSACTSGTS
jgi:hypothetical protein